MSLTFVKVSRSLTGRLVSFKGREADDGAFPLVWIINSWLAIRVGLG